MKVSIGIRPNNVVLNQLFGGFSGLSLIPITFDWTLVTLFLSRFDSRILLTKNSYVSAYLLDPLLAPAHAIVNTLIGLVVFIIIATIGISYTGALWVNQESYLATTNQFSVTPLFCPSTRRRLSITHSKHTMSQKSLGQVSLLMNRNTKHIRPCFWPRPLHWTMDCPLQL